MCVYMTSEVRGISIDPCLYIQIRMPASRLWLTLDPQQRGQGGAVYVQIQQPDPVPLVRQGQRQVDRHGGLADATLLDLYVCAFVFVCVSAGVVYTLVSNK